MSKMMTRDSECFRNVEDKVMNATWWRLLENVNREIEEKEMNECILHKVGRVISE